MVYHRAAPCNGRKKIILGRVHEPIHVLRPALIIEAHGHAEVVVAFVSAQIGYFVAHLSCRIADGSQQNCRNPQHPEIPHLFKSAHVLSFPPIKLCCGQLKKHLVFHVHTDYTTQPGGHFRGRKQVAGQQPLEIVPERPERQFLQLSIHTLATSYKIRERQQLKVRPSINCD